MIMTDWSQKYIPVKTEEVVGQKSAISTVKEFITNYRPGDKPLLLHGPPGSGKNAIVHAVASESNFELVEINASDKRNAEAVRTIVGSASKQASLFNKSKVILVDEVDGLYGVQDRGAIPEMMRVISSSKFPMIFTANNPWVKKLSSLRKGSKRVQLRKLTVEDLVSILKKICEAENIGYDMVVLKQLAESSKGDARAAINDLQTLSSNKKKITLADTSALGHRETKKSVSDALSEIFKGSSKPSVFELCDKSFEESLLWLAENLPNEYNSAEEVADAYNQLSRADVMLGRIRRWQYWRFKYYASIFASTGVSSVRKSAKTGWTTYKNPSRIIKLWRTKSIRVKRKEISKKVAEHCHCSTRIASRYFPVLRMILRKDGKVEGLDLTPQEVETLTSF
jgi:replication factor C large subunit